MAPVHDVTEVVVDDFRSVVATVPESLMLPVVLLRTSLFLMV